MKLISYLKELVPVSPELEEAIDRIFVREVFPKRHQLLLPGNASQKVFFVEEGLVRSYYVRPDGKDITHHFFTENMFSMAIEPVFHNRPSPYGLELLEKSTVVSVIYDELETFIDQHPGLEKLMRSILIDTLLLFSEHLRALQFQSAQERYQALVTRFPTILQRVPLGHIASFLGITQQTLSVIRSQR